MNIGSVPTVSSPFRKGHRLLVWRLRASGYALRPSSPHQQPILILIVAAFSSCLSPRSLTSILSFPGAAGISPWVRSPASARD